ncbi:MAG: hypothetical protein ACE5ID_10310, partial [Acidobacteriota bacterium]
VLAGGVGMALACSGIFLIPMLHQRPLVHLDWIVNSSYGDWHRNFVYRDEVAHGFTAAHIKPFVNRTATTQAIIALAALALLFLRDKAGGSKSLRDGPAGRESLAWMAVAVWTFFLQIPPSTPLWSTVPELGTIQFPWRFGLFQSLSCAFLMASVSAVFGPADSRGEHVPSPGPGQNARHGWVRQPATGIALLFLASLPALVVSAGLTGNSEFLFDAKIAQDPRVDSRVMEEYLSRTFQGWQKFKQAPFALHAGPVFRRPARWQEEGREPGVRLMRVISKEPNTLHLATILYPGWRVMVDGRQTPVREAAGRTGIAVDLPAGSHLVRLEFMRARLAGPGQLKTLLWGTEERQFQVEAPQKNRLDLRIFYHPGWKAWIDGKETLLRHDNVMNAIQVPVPSGRHQVRVALTATQDRWMGAVVSSVALATMLALAGVLAWRQRKTS